MNIPPILLLYLGAVNVKRSRIKSTFYVQQCGNDDLTSDFNWKHVFKQFRNTLLCLLKGICLNGIPFSISTLKFHLVACGMSPSTADALLQPNDKQDVVLMIRLLNVIVMLPAASSMNSPMIQATRRALRLLGHIYHHLLSAYLDVELSLHDQLTHLSAATHLILAVYHTDKGEFIPVQTFFDVMSMIKNVYFCVAKMQIDNPNSSFWIILLGTDGLEKVFGKVWTMVGNDTNADQLQLTNHIDGAVQCVKILEIHPEWGGQSRWLNLKRLPSDSNDISSKYDHINPKSWKGDVKVANVVLGSCWSSGFRQAEAELEEAMYPSPFEEMKKAGGYDIMCPFGGGKMVLVDGTSAGERDEMEEEKDTVEEPTTANEDSPILNEEDVDSDLDDIAAVQQLGLTPSGQQSPSPWIAIDHSNANTSKKVHKSMVLRLYSNPLTISDSKDCLKRVQGFSQYHESQTLDELWAPPALPSNAEDNVLCVLDPMLTVVQCNNKIFLAVFQVLGEPNVQIHGQVMKLGLITGSLEPDEPDWEWNGSFEARSSIHDVEGRWVEQIDPHVQPASRG
ncbi:hypothetical protein CPB84DRAFT_1742606 [Gymnopilus junonius]|uniref:Uncharacterized protein n=1 Tax=Gymnopilus junonius TaxID=109634 RepID=A0A9P5NY90_GYMJU|nr:hypothetical protein CPB84DRAFT_1742606 [Gymnopilus junonius]